MKYRVGTKHDPYETHPYYSPAWPEFVTEEAGLAATLSRPAAR
jgi:hypothetical protein